MLREYGVPELLLQGFRSLYSQSKSCVSIFGTRPNSFTVPVGLHQGCPLSLILFEIFMDRLLRCSRGEKDVWFGNPRAASLLDLLGFCLLLQAMTFSCTGAVHS